MRLVRALDDIIEVSVETSCQAFIVIAVGFTLKGGLVTEEVPVRTFVHGKLCQNNLKKERVAIRRTIKTPDAIKVLFPCCWDKVK